jgi:3D-(3,5/4)-trihydroxycyclohexane-1,2-dione acylhydrolase (decyclizing)
LISGSAAPLIIAGGGALYADASRELAELAETAGIPVVETQAGKGSLPWNHPWNAGPVGATGGIAANRLAAEADVVIAIGTRLSDFTTASHTAFQNPKVQIIGLNINSMDAHKLGGLPLVGDARATIEQLSARLAAANFQTSKDYGRRLAGLKEEWNDTVDQLRTVASDGPLTQANVIGMVNDASGDRAVVVCAAGGMPGDLHKLWRPVDSKSYHLEYGYSCMGYEIAGGLGVKMADPSRDVYVMVGDGSYLMLHSELVTSLQEGLKLVIVLVDNSGYQCIRGLQMSSGSPAFGNEFRYRDPATGRLEGTYIPIDFAKNAESLGAVAFRADTAEELEAALSKAKTTDRTTLIHVRVDVDARVPGFDSWWDVPIAQVSGERTVQDALEHYESARSRQRYFR